MAAPRNKIRREEHRAFIAEKYLMQWTQAEIANELGIDVSTVSRDLQAIQKAWRESAIVDMNEAKQRELERIDKLEREYWQAWEESKKDAETVNQKVIPVPQGDPVKKEINLQKKGQTGNPSYLAGVQWCIERRCKLLGVDAPENKNLGGEIVIKVVRD